MADRHLGRIVLLFKIFCVGLAIWLSTNKLRKCYLDNDISTISYGTFEETLKGPYPSFSICFVEDVSGGLIFDQKALDDVVAPPIPQSSLDDLVVDNIQMLCTRFLFGLAPIWQIYNVD